MNSSPLESVTTVSASNISKRIFPSENVNRSHHRLYRAFGWHRSLFLAYRYQHGCRLPDDLLWLHAQNVVEGCTHNMSLRLPGSWSTNQAAEVWGVSPRDTIDSMNKAQGHWYISTTPYVISTTVLLYQGRRVFVIRVGIFFVRYRCDFLAKIGNIRFQCR